MKKTDAKSLIKKTVLNQYSIGTIKSVKPVSAGLVHDTFVIKTDRGQYIIQRLHPVLASQAIAKDFLAVTKYLAEQEFPTPECVLTKKGDVLVKDGKYRWRMQTRISGVTVHTLKDRAMAKEAGEMYARFHRVLDNFEYKFKSTKILHETEKEYQRFLDVVDPYLSGEKEVLGERPDEVIRLAKQIKQELPKYFLPNTLPLRVIHGDPKVSNILFDRNGKAKAIIDLDTCNRRPLLVELGDAFRSWCGNEEDDPKNKFCLRMFQSAWLGYKKGADGFMTKEEKKHLPKAIGTITLELASRFLRDYFTDNYFGWDASRYDSRRAHNLARCKGQMIEFEDYKKKLPKIRAMLAK